MALSASTFTAVGGAVQDLFSSDMSAKGLRIKAEGDRAEAATYDLAGGLARENEKFTETSTSIKEMQQERELSMNLGAQRATVAGAGFEASGSALDLLRDSASQGALQHQVLAQQGLITEAGYEEQAKSYDILSTTARSAADQEDKIADETKTAGYISAALKGVAAVASVAAVPFTGGTSLAALPALAATGRE